MEHHSYPIQSFRCHLTHLEIIATLQSSRMTSEWQLFAFDYRLTLISIVPLGPAWACHKVWRIRLRREVRLQERVWNDIMASFFVLDSSELKMMVERIKRGRNDKMWRVLFGCRSLGNDLRTTFFSFRCRSGVKGRRREEERTKKVGCFSIGNYMTTHMIKAYPFPCIS